MKTRSPIFFSIIGLLGGYFIISPLIMHIFHIVHANISVHSMNVLEVYQPTLVLWTFPVTLLCGSAGLYVGILHRRSMVQTRRAQEAKDYISLVHSSMNEGMVIIDRDYRIVDANMNYLTQLGELKEDDVIGNKCHAISHRHEEPCNEDGHYCPVREVFETGEPATAVHTHYNKTGEKVYVKLYAYPIKNSRGKVVRAIEMSKDITEVKRAQDEIYHLAYYDSLTGLPNRILLLDRLGQIIARASRDGRKVSVLLLDLDQFKRINDTFGHTSGDKLLKVTAQRLSEISRKSDTVARLGGDEFVLVLSSITSEESITCVADKILQIFSAPVELGGREIFTGCSIGISVFPADGGDAGTLLKNAETAMYQAKDAGRNNSRFFSKEMNISVAEKMALDTSLRRALERDEFFLHYQPQVDMRTGRMVGMEALLRWRHPSLGVLHPDRFIPLAEETGLILPIGEWVLRTACSQNKAWQESGLVPLRVAVNLSARQFRQEGFIEMVGDILKDTGLSPLLLELELTESTIMTDDHESTNLLHQLKQMGINLAIDDFGTGHSSLSYLTHFPIDRLKIDKSFIQDITTNPDHTAITEAIIAMAKSLKMEVIAEGVERKEQLRYLAKRRCDAIQGYYLSHPLSVDDFSSLMNMGIILKERFDGPEE